MSDEKVVTCSLTPNHAIEELLMRADYLEKHFPAHEACAHSTQSQIDAMRMGAEAIKRGCNQTEIDYAKCLFLTEVIILCSGKKKPYKRDIPTDSDLGSAVNDIYGAARSGCGWTRCSEWLYEKLNGFKYGERK